MGKIIFVLFVGVPVLEIAIFIQVGGWLGLWPTVGLILLTAVLGTALLRQQGLATLARAQTAMDRGEMPMTEVIHGLFLLIAGVLLLTPGFATDLVGFLLFVPAIRLALGGYILHRMLASGGNFHVHTARTTTATRGENVIEGEFEPVEDDKDRNRPKNNTTGPD